MQTLGPDMLIPDDLDRLSGYDIMLILIGFGQAELREQMEIWTERYHKSLMKPN